MTWVHLPDDLDTWLYSRELEAASSLRAALGGTPFAPSSGTRFARIFFSPECETECWASAPYGTTCGPSTATRGEGRSISSPPDSPASHFRSQESNAASTTPKTCGPTRAGSFARYDPGSRSWKTSQGSLLPLMGISAPFSVTWPPQGMTLGGASYLLPTLELPTAEKGSGSSVPTAGDSRNSRNCTANGGAGSTGNAGTTLCDYVTIYPTPTATPYGRNRSGSVGAKARPSLMHMARHGLWPTPTARDYKDSGENTDYARAAARGILAGVVVERGGPATPQTGNLNPGWVEWLMGWPMGWTQRRPLPDGDLEEWDGDQAPTRHVARVGREIPDRASRLKALGNGWVPASAAAAFSMLIAITQEEEER